MRALVCKKKNCSKRRLVARWHCLRHFKKFSKVSFTNTLNNSGKKVSNIFPILRSTRFLCNVCQSVIIIWHSWDKLKKEKNMKNKKYRRKRWLAQNENFEDKTWQLKCCQFSFLLKLGSSFWHWIRSAVFKIIYCWDKEIFPVLC